MVEAHTENAERIKSEVFAAIAVLLDEEAPVVSDETILVGEAGLMDSMKLVELCLLLEEISEDLGFRFDWTAHGGVSAGHNMFESAGALAAEVVRQANGQL